MTAITVIGAFAATRLVIHDGLESTLTDQRVRMQIALVHLVLATPLEKVAGLLLGRDLEAEAAHCSSAVMRRRK